MRKILCTCLLWIAMLTAAHAGYLNYLYDNPAIPIIYGHMGGATYLDTTSIVVKKYDSDGIIFAQNQIYVSYNRDVTEIKNIKAPATVWFYKPLNPSKQYTTAFIDNVRDIILPPYVGEDVAYVSYDNAKSWTPFYISNKTGVNMSKRNAFLMGYQAITG